MKMLTPVIAVAIALTTAGLISAEEMKSGLQTGEKIGAFYVTKPCGAEDDGVEVGENLCYRCRNGGRPQVMVFTRSSDKNVVELIKKLDEAIPENERQQLRAFVNYLGADKTAAKMGVQKLAEDSKAKNVPFVLPNDLENGPANYGLNEDAEVTVILAENGKVKANHSAASAKKLDVKAVVADLEKILN